MSYRGFEMWAPFLPASIRRRLRLGESTKETLLVTDADLDRWVRQHFRRNFTKTIPSWVYQWLYRTYRKPIEADSVVDLKDDLTRKVKEYIVSVVEVSLSHSDCSYTRDDSKCFVIEGEKRREAFDEVQALLTLHGFEGVTFRIVAETDVLTAYLDLTDYRGTAINSPSIWLLLHEYRRTPIRWNGQIWIPDEVPADADATTEHLL